MRPRVLIADDHQMFADSLHALLGQTYEVIGVVKDRRELIETAVRHKPDVILTDLAMPHITGLDAIPAIKQKGVKSKFVVLTMHGDLSLAVLVFRAGASAFLLKTARGEELKEALETVLRGGYYLSQEMFLRSAHCVGRGGAAPSIGERYPTHEAGRRGSDDEGSRERTKHLHPDRGIL